MLLRPLAKAIGLVDIPSGRKNHAGNIPLIGGLAIFFGVLISIFVHEKFIPSEALTTSPLPSFFLAGFILLVVGALDDYRPMPASVRLLAQVIASLVMIYGGGTVLTDLGYLSFNSTPLALGMLAVPFTVFACLGVINAMNMCDGLDGLSGSMALIALLGFGIANTLWGDMGNQYLIVAFAACVASFLMFNLRTLWFSNAWVFLGDAGSMFLGMALSWMAISLSQGAERAITPASALWFLMLPVYDAVCMMVRRILKKHSPFAADREHLHHIFLLAGFSVGETVTLMSGIAVAGVVVGLGSIYFQLPDLLVAVLFLSGGGLYYFAVSRAWRVMRFLSRSICRRKQIERRSPIARRKGLNVNYTGPERRSNIDRRQESIRRTN
ncbi:MAG: undecaprenyl/decaprenyl-phosphate alpha-N-acetylglucosaminyl 1-phosphate transferase [Gammaproteobacteria bacterium]|nr:undecaprenyl/decaprenyl-phosphate alpha-N-acetylglucosaminyl 1-phosphate transferase [Gammaproteobacteria bacterium]MCP4088862.1 undecaprenyl/decaprenyl-phosphate alpha-N-acetylglucosaminyl 1-phosphate transferase [Gammaproteobacteria bacterium]MCP4274878.1 undecaprenyl/decaprenyl-phosphate alpha-N-acetylglucosaminyl 1-phosphate transferase [Gammaproteobacteria bacterium]MCP4832055.1 undecaprenyl/decaprenyl-phosphate alpha-N-acetylglucosaminyl 1-phosphate transferase [Gammaproteobacteria bact